MCGIIIRRPLEILQKFVAHHGTQIYNKRSIEWQIGARRTFCIRNLWMGLLYRTTWQDLAGCPALLAMFPKYRSKLSHFTIGGPCVVNIPGMREEEGKKTLLKSLLYAHSMAK